MADELIDLQQSKYWWYVAAVKFLTVNLCYTAHVIGLYVDVRRGGLTSPFKHKYGDSVSRVRTSPSTTFRTHMFYLDIWKDRKRKKGRCQKARNGPEPYLWGREAAQMDDHTIGCLCWAVIVQYVIAYVLWFRIHISLATNSLVFAHLCCLGVENID